jgi:hypothetical protein
MPGSDVMMFVRVLRKAGTSDGVHALGFQSVDQEKLEVVHQAGLYDKNSGYRTAKESSCFLQPSQFEGAIVRPPIGFDSRILDRPPVETHRPSQDDTLAADVYPGGIPGFSQ